MQRHQTFSRYFRPLWVSAVCLCVIVGLYLAPATAHGDSIESITICHGFGCRYQETVTITPKEWRQIKAFFREPAETPEQERDQIRRAAGWFDVIAGRHSPIHLDEAKNGFPDRFKPARLGKDEVQQAGKRTGQMDCIDESRNMTTYLTMMEQAGLFQHHRVVERAHRQSAVDQHYAGQIEEIETGTRWVLDSWFYAHGSLPYLEEASEWHDIPFLFSTSFPEAGDS